ncbi:MAG: phosphatase PAP2 family protein [Leptospira sp.]|nr:phosphatase PAP2 family protein [Leptospira sp.]
MVSRIDLYVAGFIQKRIQNEKLGWILSRVNRGEVFFLVLIPFIAHYSKLSEIPFLILITGIFTFLNDRLVLFIKKAISRKRPLISVMGKTDANPDMKHSFPSAHAANSMIVAVILVSGFGYPEVLFLFSFLAGIGRLLTLHHFVSDIIGGWILGFFFGTLGVICKNFFFIN